MTELIREYFPTAHVTIDDTQVISGHEKLAVHGEHEVDPTDEYVPVAHRVGRLAELKH